MFICLSSRNTFNVFIHCLRIPTRQTERFCKQMASSSSSKAAPSPDIRPLPFLHSQAPSSTLFNMTVTSDSFCCSAQLSDQHKRRRGRRRRTSWEGTNFFSSIIFPIASLKKHFLLLLTTKQYLLVLIPVAVPPPSSSSFPYLPMYDTSLRTSSLARPA